VVNARTDYLSILIGVSRNNATLAVTLSELFLPEGKTFGYLIDSYDHKLTRSCFFGD